MAPTDSRRVSVLLGLLFGLVGMGSSSAAIALPLMAREFGVGVGVAAWTISLYALMLAVTTAVYGRVSDLVGVRIPLAVGISLMTGGALVAALAPTYPVLLTARLFQGAGAAAVPTLGVAVLSARYDGPVRGLAFGRLAGVAAAISCLGPLAGGLVEHAFGWRMVMALPILGVLVIPFLWHALTGEGTGAHLDILGAVLVAGTAAGLVLLVQSPSTGVAVAVAGVLLLVLGAPAVALRVRHRPHGFLPVTVIRNPVVVRSALAAAAVPAAWFALLIAVPAVLVGVGWSPWQVGLALVPSAVVALGVPRVAGPLLDRIGAARSLAVAGVIASGALVLAAVGAQLTSGVILGVAVVLVTLAFGLGQPALSASVGEAVHEHVRGVALGVATLLFLVGGSVGSAVVGGLGDVIGLPWSLALLALLPLLGLLALAPHLRSSYDTEPCRCAIVVISAHQVRRMFHAQEVRSAAASTREGPYQVSSRPLTSSVGVRVNASGPSSAVKTYGSSGSSTTSAPAASRSASVHLGVALGVVGVDVGQAEPPGQVAGERRPADDHPRVAPDRDRDPPRHRGHRAAPEPARLGQPVRPPPAEGLVEEPLQRGDRLGHGLDVGHPDGDTGVAQAAHVELAVLLLVGDDQVGGELRDRPRGPGSWCRGPGSRRGRPGGCTSRWLPPGTPAGPRPAPR